MLCSALLKAGGGRLGLPKLNVPDFGYYPWEPLFIVRRECQVGWRRNVEYAGEGLVEMWLECKIKRKIKIKMKNVQFNLELIS